jgi:hypothetical protein
MFRIIKRSPWIALGAAGAWFLDPMQGPQRRSMLTVKARQWKNDLKSSRPSTTPVGDSFAGSGTPLPSEYTDPALRSA